MVAQKQPPQQAPPVQKLRVQYAKRGPARFSSHRDFGRAFERALRRAGIPMAFSSGFNPHPRISFANAAPTGAASEAEYLEIGLARVCDPERVREALDAALPNGLSVERVSESGGASLADRLTGSLWEITWPGQQLDLTEPLAAFLARDEVAVERMTKNGMREFDARGPVLRAEGTADRLELLIRHEVPLVRPDDVLKALAVVAPQWSLPAGVLVNRLAQGTLVDGELRDPLAED